MSAGGRGADEDDDPHGDAAYGLTPREWLETDAVPLTPDIDLDDPEQRIAWIRANNEAMFARSEELARRRGRGPAASSRPAGGSSAGVGSPGRGTTGVIGVRLLNEERRAVARIARHEDLTVSDLVRRWVRLGLAAASEDSDPEEGLDRGFPAQGTGDETLRDPEDPADPDEERAELRRALLASADATVERITDELRRLREIVAATG